MTPNPSNVSPWYLRNINQALALDDATGNVYLRTGFEGNIIISGNVNIPGNIDAHISEIGTSGNLTVPWMPVSIDGNSAVTITSGNITVAQGTSPWVVSGNVNANVSGNVGVAGNVNIGTMPNVNANITGGNVTVSQGTNPWLVSGNVGISGNANVILADDANVIISGFSGATHDAFGRLRVSNPYTLFDTQARYYDHGQFASSTSGTSSVTYDLNSSTFMCNVGTASGDSVLRETVKTFPYQPGKSLLIMTTFCMNAPKANLRQRAGFFNSENGIFFEVNGTTLNMVIRSSSSGSIVEDRIPQSSWNEDTLLGTGGAGNPSGITLNPAYDQIFWTDVEWLGVGSVRVGFVINGVYIICHTFNHANIVGNTTTYMTTATLPLRYEITNTGITASSSMLRQICSSVISEGGFNISGSGNPRSAAHVLGTPVRLPNNVSFLPVMSIRLKSSNLDAVVVPMVYTLTPVQQSLFQYRVYKKAITSGGTWVSSASDSSVEYNLTPTSLVSGDIAEQAFLNSSNQSSGSPTQVAFGFEYQLERDPFTGVAYEYVIMMATTGTNQDVYASIEWQEIT